MEKENKLIEETQKAHDDVTSFSLELLQDKNEYLDVKANFFENQTLIINKIIHKIELIGKKLSIEEQELSDKLAEGAEVKKNLANILKCLKSQQKVKRDKSFIKIKGFYHCPECPYKTKRFMRKLKVHIDAVHRKLKPWKCSNCAKGKLFNAFQLKYFIKQALQFQILHQNITYHNID